MADQIAAPAAGSSPPLRPPFTPQEPPPGARRHGPPIPPFPATTSEFRALSTAEFRALRHGLEAARARATRAPLPLRWIVAAVAVVLLVAIGAAMRLGRGGDAPLPARPVIAIASIHPLRGDTSRTWMAEGLGQMIAAKLSRSSAVDVIPPERVRELKVRARLEGEPQLTDEQILDLGRRLGATWVVSGGITGGDSTLVFVLTVRDVATGRVLQPDAVAGANVLVLADAAASRLLDAAGGTGSGPRLADVETSSVEAAEHFGRAMLASNGGLATAAARELDAAIALDSGFITAIRARMDLAVAAQDSETLRRLRGAFERHKGRATEWDRRRDAVMKEWYDGDAARAEALARDLVRRFPRDPRAYGQLAAILIAGGKWDESELVLRAELALDSLAAEAGSGACAVCGAYQGLAEVRWLRGDLAGAEQALRRWLALQPELPLAWERLAAVLAYQQRFDAALDANRRALILSGGESQYEAQMARTLIMMRAHDRADSVITALLAGGERSARLLGYDLRTLLERERGRLRASNAAIDALEAEFPTVREFELTRGNNLGRLGAYAEAARVYERATHMVPMSEVKLPMPPGLSRAYAWHHALLADAIAPSGDTAKVRVIADSLLLFSAGSYYGRDWRLHHHARGLLLARRGLYESAAREFRAAMWGAAGWTRSNVELAKAEMALGRPRDAIATLRTAYAAPLDAMGRYQPRSEVDLLMALAFRRAGMDDSAAVYGAHVRRAWRNADPEVARELEALTR